MFRILNLKICKDFDQSSNINLVALYFPLQLLGSQKFAHSSKIWRNRPMKMVQCHCTRAFRVFSQSRRRAQSLTAIWPMNIGEPSFPRARLLRISRNLSRPGALNPLSPPRDHASRRQAYWPSPLPSTRLFAARSTSPRPCLALECLPVG